MVTGRVSTMRIILSLTSLLSHKIVILKVTPTDSQTIVKRTGCPVKKLLLT